MLDLFVLDAASGKRLPSYVEAATQKDLAATRNWQTDWTSPAAAGMPNKMALRLKKTEKLLGLMSYELDEKGLAVEIVYVESASHSNANLLHAEGGQKRYYGIAKALFAYAVQISLDEGFGGVLVFKAKTSELVDYYMRVFGARQVAAYDPFRMVIWEDAAERLVAEFRRDTDD